MPGTELENNKTVRILNAAESGGYGVLAAIAYNIEQILGLIAAAESTRSPLIIQFFPWAITFSSGLLIQAASFAASRATVPIALHLDHCQDAGMVRHAAATLPFDSIMIDMSHFERGENLRLTRELVAYCHARGIATEAEPGRIEGGEDGIADTEDLEGVFTTDADIDDFCSTGVDFLAPAFGNIHGEYGTRGPVLDLGLLERVAVGFRERGVRTVVHGTNGWSEDVMKSVVTRGVSKINVNKLVLEEYSDYVAENASEVGIVQLMENGVEKVKQLTEAWMIRCGSAGQAK